MEIELNNNIFRSGHKLATREVNFVVSGGGIGDYMGYIGCLQWIARNHPQIEAKVYCGAFMIEFCENVFSEFENWSVFDRDCLTEKLIREIPTFGPYTTPINGTGGHPLDLGFIYYCNINPAPPDAYYPEVNFNLVKDFPPGNYAVISAGAASPKNRVLLPKAFNGIKEHIIKRGLIPVLLGKTQITENRKVSFHNEYDFTGCENLIDKTSLLEAAKIIDGAKFIVGLDNGLLHLAGCTKAPIIFGYNIAAPWHRRPRRRVNYPILEIFPDKKALSCVFCQSQMRFMFNHDFEDCVYKDFKCLEILNEPSTWCNVIDVILTK